MIVVFDFQVDLLDFIDWSGVECLNQSSSHSLPNALKQVFILVLIVSVYIVVCFVFVRLDIR